MAIAGPYCTIEDVFNLARVYLDDTQAGVNGTAGEGLIFIDTWPPILTILNEAIAEYQRDLSNLGVDRMKKEVSLFNLPPINGPLGASTPDPTVQVRLGFDGYFDGSLLWPKITLPYDLYQPTKVQGRISNTYTTFGDLDEAQDGLPSIIQDMTLGQWEWRNDGIYFNGSVISTDIHLRYEATARFFTSTTPPSTFATTSIPFLDAQNALAYRCAHIFTASTTGAQAAQDLLAHYNEEILKIANRETRQKQGIGYTRQSFGPAGFGFGWNLQ